MALLDGGYAPLPHLVYPQSTWPPLHLAFLHIRSAHVLVTPHIHPTLWHLRFDPPTSQAGRVFVYETSLIETRYNRTWEASPSAYNDYGTELLSIRITVLARDSLAYFVIVFGLWMLALGDHYYWLVAFLFFLACMASIVVTDAKGSVMDSMIQMWVNIPLAGLWVFWICPHCHFSPTQCITSIAVRYVFFTTMILI